MDAPYNSMYNIHSNRRKEMTMEQKEKSMLEHANAILATFNGKTYDGESMMAIIGYVLAQIMRLAIEQNGYTQAMHWFRGLVRSVEGTLKNNQN